MTSRWRKMLAGATAGAVACLTAGCAALAPSASGSARRPILIGISLSTTGQFSTDGNAFERGYELWAQDINNQGGLLHRPVKLIVLDDKSSPTQAQANYTKLIRTDHVQLILGPFSSLITAPAAVTAGKLGYAMIEGAGGAPTVFQQVAAHHLNNVFDVSIPVKDEMNDFATWIAHLRAGKPTTAAYPTSNNIFAYPPVDNAQTILTGAGVQTVYTNKYPEAQTASAISKDYGKVARAVVNSHAQIVVLGSTTVQTVAFFMRIFEKENYTPEYFIAAAGPDQGQAFLNAVGQAQSQGVMVPNGWYGGVTNPLSSYMVQDYIAKYGGNESSINADVAEAYSCGEVLARAVNATHGTSNAAIIRYLHSGVTIQTVQGPVQFDSTGENPALTPYIFQWQGGQFVRVLPAGRGAKPILKAGF